MKRFLWDNPAECMIIVAILAVLTSPFWSPPAPAKKIDASDIQYFRDDYNQICYAYVKRLPAMTVVDCEKVRW